MENIFFLRFPTVSLSSWAIKLYISSDTNCKRDGTIERVFTVTVKKIDIIITVKTITKDELVNDKSTLPAFNSIYGIISNCSKGLCFSPVAAIFYNCIIK